jgi:hypothetical protein
MVPGMALMARDVNTVLARSLGLQRTGAMRKAAGVLGVRSRSSRSITAERGKARGLRRVG